MKILWFTFYARHIKFDNNSKHESSDIHPTLLTILRCDILVVENPFPTQVKFVYYRSSYQKYVVKVYKQSWNIFHVTQLMMITCNRFLMCNNNIKWMVSHNTTSLQTIFSCLTYSCIQTWVPHNSFNQCHTSWNQHLHPTLNFFILQH
jgi:hypothetical protein